MLLAAIRQSATEGSGPVEQAIETARKQFIEEHAMTVGGDPYEALLRAMHHYLSRGYDTGAGPLFTQTPLELCAQLHADKAAEAIRKALHAVSQAKTSSTVSGSEGAEQKERVQLAKERLRAFQQTHSKRAK